LCANLLAIEGFIIPTLHALALKNCKDGKASEKVRFAQENLPGMWPAIFMAQKVGKIMAGGEILQ